MRLSIHSRDLWLLRAHYGENTYYPADLVWRNIRVRNIGVRSRGFDSRSPVKLGIQIDFDKYTPTQTFLGLQALVLDNLRQDPSMIREPLAMALFARMQEPAPRESFCRLFINNVYQGLYTMVEDIDPVFLARTFGRDDGYLFEYHWSQPYYGDYPGNDLGVYPPLFEARTHEHEPLETLYEPMRALFAAMNTDDAVARDELESHLDLEQFVRVLAIEMFLGDHDGILGVNGMNNFYLYREPGSMRHSWILWDRDRALSQVYSPIFDRVDQNALARRALAYPELLELYLQTIEATALMASDEGWLGGEIERLAVLLGPAVDADTRRPYSTADFEAAIDFLREFARVRPARVLEEVAAIRGGPRGPIGVTPGRQ